MNGRWRTIVLLEGPLAHCECAPSITACRESVWITNHFLSEHVKRWHIVDVWHIFTQKGKSVWHKCLFSVRSWMSFVPSVYAMEWQWEPIRIWSVTTSFPIGTCCFRLDWSMMFRGRELKYCTAAGSSSPSIHSWLKSGNLEWRFQSSVDFPCFHFQYETKYLPGHSWRFSSV